MKKKIKKYQTEGEVPPDALQDAISKGIIEPPVRTEDEQPTAQQWYDAVHAPEPPKPQYKRKFDPFNPNAWGVGIMGAYLGTKALLNKSEDRNYEAYKSRWIRNYSMPSLLHDPNKFGSEMYESPIYKKGGLTKYQTKGLVPPTTQDSLNVYNAQIAQNQYYAKYSKYFEPRNAVSSDILKMYTDELSSGENTAESLQTARDDFRWASKNKIYADVFGMSPEQVKKKTAEAIVKYKSVPKDANQIPYQDLITGMIDFNAPFSIYDKRIKPQGLISRTALGKETPTFPGNNVTTVYYDPIAVKPYNMLTPQERLIRDAKYGSKKPAAAPTPQIPSVNKTKIPIEAQTSLSEAFNLPGMESLVRPQLSDKKTPYSFTFHGGESDRDQRVVYFKTKKELNDFLKQNANVTSGSGDMSNNANPYTTVGTLKKRTGGMTMRTKEDQAGGYNKYPNASYLEFPGKGERTFVPGPFPLLVKDDNGTQILNKKPIKTKGRVVEIPIFQDGGEVRTQAIKVDRKDATIEAEKGEVIFGAGAPGPIEDQEDRVGAGLYRIGGQKHSKGGTPLKAFPGDFVYSDDPSLAFDEKDAKELVGKTIKTKRLRTPARLASKYLDLNKFIHMTQDKELDSISKKTAILNINNYVDRLAEIAYAQEEKKDFPNGLPEFVETSLSGRFQENLQAQLDQYKYGGELKKYQTRGVVTEDIVRKARRVDQSLPDYNLYGAQGNKTYYNKTSQPSLQTLPSGSGDPNMDPYKLLEIYGTRKTNNLSVYSYDDLLKMRALKMDTPELRTHWNKYYKGQEDFIYTEGMKAPLPQVVGGVPTPTLGEPGFGTGNLDYSTPPPNSPEAEQPLKNYMSIPNNQFNLNLAETVGLYGALKPYQSRYPTAYRNYEIQNAKAMISSTGRPISEQPYLNAIRRSSLGYDQNNNSYGAAGASRSLGAFNASLGAQNQAVSQVYNQNIARADQRATALAQLELQDGVDRITNAEKYDTKLETLANNKEMADKYKMANVTAQLNQMQKSREEKTLFNQMSEFYQINPDYSFGLKPTYRIENGKLIQEQRNMADLIKSQGQSSNTAYLSTLENVFRMMNKYGIRSSAFIDDVIDKSMIPQRRTQ